MTSRALFAAFGTLCLTACHSQVYIDEPTGPEQTTTTGSTTSSSTGGSAGAGGAGTWCPSASWARRFGGDLPQRGEHVATGLACEVILSASSTGPIDLGGGALSGKYNQGTALAKLGSSGGTVWSRWLESDHGPVVISAIAVDAAGAPWIAGTFRGTLDLGAGPMHADDFQEAFVAKLNGDGYAVWSKHYRASSGFDGYAPITIALDPSGGAVIAGSFFGTVDFGTGPIDSLGLDLFVARLDDAGELGWVNTFGGPGNTLDEIVSVAIGPAGQILIAGEYEGVLDLGAGPFPFKWGGAFVAALDPSGEVIWSRPLDASCAFASCPLRVAFDAAGRASVAGVKLTSTADLSVFIALHDEAGAPVATHDLKGASVGGLVATKDGGFVVAGDLGEAAVAKLDASGAIVWTDGALPAAPPGNPSRGAADLALDLDGRAVVVGAFTSVIELNDAALQSAGDADVFVARR